MKDECFVELQIMNMMRGAGKHRNKKNRVEKKPAASPKNQEPVRGHQEHDEEKVIKKSESVQGEQEPKNDKSLLSCEGIVDWAEGNNSDMEQWIQIFSEVTGLVVQEWSE